jgi:hypothetical protein
VIKPEQTLTYKRGQTEQVNASLFTDLYVANASFLNCFVDMGHLVHGILRLIAEKPAT